MNYMMKFQYDVVQSYRSDRRVKKDLSSVGNKGNETRKSPKARLQGWKQMPLKHAL